MSKAKEVTDILTMIIDEPNKIESTSEDGQ